MTREEGLKEGGRDFKRIAMDGKKAPQGCLEVLMNDRVWTEKKNRGNRAENDGDCDISLCLPTSCCDCLHCNMWHISH